MTRRIKLGFISLTELSPDDAAEYVEWHQMDHMPEQFRISGLAWGQRFVATPACVAASLRRLDPFASVQHLQQYLMENADQVLPAFSTLGRELDGQGRYRRNTRAPLQRAFQLVATWAAPRILVHPDAVAFRPNHGVYLVIHDCGEPSEAVDKALRRAHAELMPALMDLPGVAGATCFAHRPASIDQADANSPGAFGLPASPLHLTVIYLDGDPIRVAAGIAPILERTWSTAPGDTVFAGPFRSYFPPPTSWDPADLDRAAEARNGG